MAERYGEYFFAGPWFSFLSASQRRWCQPDGLYIDPFAGHILVCEIKYQHTPDSWWQLRRLYLPVLAAAFPPPAWRISCLEIVRWLDPSVEYPEPILLVRSPHEHVSPQIGVHILTP